MKTAGTLFFIALMLNGVSDLDHMSKTNRLFDEQKQTIESLKQDIKSLQDQNAELQDDIQCLRHNANDKVFPCVSTIGVSNYE